MTVFGNGQVHVAFEFIDRLVGVDADRTRNRVTAEQGALWALDHFRPGDIVKGRLYATGAPGPDSIQKHRHRGIATDTEIIGHDSAHGQRIGETVFRPAAETRCKIDQASHVVNIGIPEEIASERRDREGHLLQGLFTFLCRYRYFFQNHFLCRDIAAPDQCGCKSGRRKSKRKVFHTRLLLCVPSVES